MTNSLTAATLPRFGRRWIAISIALCAVTVIGCATLIIMYPETDWAYSESGPIEYFQIGVWIVAVFIAAAALLLHRDRVSRLMDFWILTLAVGASGRELDLHRLLDPGGFLGDLGMRHKTDWWLSADVPLWLKLAWALAHVILAALLAVPPLLVNAPPIRLLRAGDGASWTFIFAVAFLGIGYLADDVFGRELLVSEHFSRAIEETAESIGAVLFAISAAITLKHPISQRIQAVAHASAAPKNPPQSA